MAATVLLCRARPDARVEVLVVVRSPNAQFMSGFHAFPGGRHDAADGPLGAGVEADLDTARRTAVRETREEVGLSLDPDRLEHVGVWRTPDYLVTPIRTHFFRVHLEGDEGDAAQVDGHELVSSAWRTADEILADWEAGRCLLAPPTRFLLRTLAQGLDGFAARALLAPESQGIPPHFAPIRADITLFPLRTPTLPPATHTNAYVVGRQRLVVVDPAAIDPAEQALLVAHLDARCAAGARVEAVLLTHAHADHVATAPVLAARYGVPVLCHADALPALRFAAQGLLTDLATVPFGDTPLQVLHTPGHAPGHIVYWHAESRTSICGDLVAGVGTILVDPDEGDLRLYLESLARVRDLRPAALLPAHGGAIGGAVEKLAQYIAHRLWREAKIADALTAAPQTLDALVARAYDDTPPHIWPIARQSLRAHLHKLREDTRAVETSPGEWAARTDAPPADL